MADSFTATYNLIKPEVGASRDVWGDKWNTNADSIDGILNGKMDVAGDTVTGLVNYTGAPPQIAGAEIATKAWVTAQLLALIPNGIITQWKGTVASIPAGWALCDGSNGTPNLVNSFIVAAGGTYAPGATGGSNTITGFTDYHALTADQNGPHAHGVTDPGHNHSYNDPGHNHNYNRIDNSAAPREGTGSSIVLARYEFDGFQTTTNFTGISIYPASTGISIQSSGSGEGHRHAISHDNRPVYYALCFIMKL